VVVLEGLAPGAAFAPVMGAAVEPACSSGEPGSCTGFNDAPLCAGAAGNSACGANIGLVPGRRRGTACPVLSPDSERLGTGGDAIRFGDGTGECAGTAC
jgi:hypothetical protein